MRKAKRKRRKRTVTTKRRDVSHLKVHHAMYKYYYGTRRACAGIKKRRLDKMGAQNIQLTEASSFHENRIFREQRRLQISERARASKEEDTRPMALSDAAKDWFSRNGLEEFLQIAEAPPHEEPERVALQIDLDEITEGMVQALTSLPARGLYSIENPSTETLTEYFGEYSIASKAYRNRAERIPCSERWLR